jgi:hypothetical protein
MSTEEKYAVPKESRADIAHTIVKAAISGAPVVGGPAAELFALVIAPPLQKRQAEWMNEIAEGLKEVEQRTEGFTIESLKDHPQFISAVLNASQAAMRNHQAEKLEALRNAVLNVAIGSGLDEDTETIFLVLIDRYTPWHLRILRLLQNPLELGAAKGMRPENYYAGSRSQLLEEYYPELKGQRQFYDIIVADLVTQGMLSIRDVQGNITGHGMFQKVTSQWGDRFVAFITFPNRS